MAHTASITVQRWHMFGEGLQCWQNPQENSCSAAHRAGARPNLCASCPVLTHLSCVQPGGRCTELRTSGFSINSSAFPPSHPSPRDRSHAIWGDEAPIRSIPPRQKGKAPCGLLTASRLSWDTRSQTQHLEPYQELGCSFLVARGGLEMFSGKTSCLVYPAPFPRSLCRQRGNSVQGQLKGGVQSSC